MSVLNPKDYIPTVKSSDKDWELFYDSLSKHFSKKDASAVWLKYWGARGGKVAGNTNELRQYMEKKGIKIEAGSLVGSLITSGSDAISSIGDSIGGVFGIGKSVVIGASVIAGLLIVGLGYRIFKSGVSAGYGGANVNI